MVPALLPSPGGSPHASKPRPAAAMASAIVMLPEPRCMKSHPLGSSSTPVGGSDYTRLSAFSAERRVCDALLGSEVVADLDREVAVREVGVDDVRGPRALEHQVERRLLEVEAEAEDRRADEHG